MFLDAFCGLLSPLLRNVLLPKRRPNLAPGKRGVVLSKAGGLLHPTERPSPARGLAPLARCIPTLQGPFSTSSAFCFLYLNSTARDRRDALLRPTSLSTSVVMWILENEGEAFEGTSCHNLPASSMLPFPLTGLGHRQATVVAPRQEVSLWQDRRRT